MARRSIAVAILVVLLALLSGCGLTQNVQEKAAEKLVTSAVEKATGVKVDPGKQSVTLTGQDGEKVELVASQDGKVPVGFVLPVLPGFTTDGFVESKTNGRLSWLGTFTFKSDFKQTVETYVAEMEALGLEVSTMMMEGEGIAFVNGKLGGKPYSGMVTFGKSEDGLGEIAIMFGESEEQ